MNKKTSLYKFLEKALNPEQQKPLFRTIQNAVILASAGSGKTRTLVYAIAKEIIDGVDPARIVAFTFTEKAAEELVSRVNDVSHKQISNVDLSGIQVGTIHSWCFNFLLKEPEFYNFDPLDELHLDSLVGRCYDDLRIDKIYGTKFPKGIESFLKDLEIFYNELVPLKSLPNRISPAILSFIELLQNNRLMAFGDMIRNAILLLSKKYPNGLPDLECLFVDEYQDVNPAQVELIKAMCGPKTRLVAVGDDLQCIYQWRGSDVQRIVNFTSDFPKSKPFALKVNYRSRPQIIRFANNASQNITIRTSKKMQSKRISDSGPNVCWYHAKTEEDQADATVKIVENLRKNGAKHGDIAVLMRSVLSSGRSIVEALEKRGIPVECPILSRSGDFINNVVVPLFDWLRRENAEPRNEQEYKEREEKSETLWKATSRWTLQPLDKTSFLKALGSWKKAINKEKPNAYNVRLCLYDFFDIIGIHITKDNRDLMLAMGIATQIIRSVEEVQRRRLRRFTRKKPISIMSDVYFALLLNKDEYGESLPLDTTRDAVIVSTIHQAKGLEWPIVIIPTLNKRRFPLRNQHHGTSFPDTIAARYGTTQEDEWRLFYVAITRAQERIVLCSYGSEETSLSEFLIRLKKNCTKLTAGHIKDSSYPTWKISLDQDSKPEKILRIALTDLLLYIDCPFQYGLRRICGIQPIVGDELGYGRSLHELVQRRIKHGRKWTTKEINEEVDGNVFMPYASSEQEHIAKKAIEERIDTMERIGLFDSQTEPEVHIEVFFNSGQIYGIIDGVQTSDGKTIIRDWKSNIHPDFEKRYRLQIQSYVSLLEKKGINVSAAEIIDIGASNESKKIVAISLDCSLRAKKAILEIIQNSFDSLAKGNFNPAVSKGACARCDVNKICGERISVS